MKYFPFIEYSIIDKHPVFENNFARKYLYFEIYYLFYYYFFFVYSIIIYDCFQRFLTEIENLRKFKFISSFISYYLIFFISFERKSCMKEIKGNVSVCFILKFYSYCKLETSCKKYFFWHLF